MTFPFHTLMVQGTTSNAGKTTVVAALCRLLAQRGVSVAPFKPQNMALNSAVTANGGEIGRAQALQAWAAGIAPHTDMNPVLLKPYSDTAAQLIIQGQAVANREAQDYFKNRLAVMPAVLESYYRLRSQYQALIVEGAGSPAEVNLRENDIANMGFAEAVDCPVILVADIEPGGLFAHIVGTLYCLSSRERARVIGFVINRFRGDFALLQPGIAWLEKETCKPVLAVLPYLHGLHLDSEDAIEQAQPVKGQFIVLVPAIPRISNHTDFDALRAHPGVDLRFVGPGQSIPYADLIVLPGSKNTRADLAWLIENGWGAALRRHLRYGGKLIGICGGFQMLGEAIHDPRGVEGQKGSVAGFGFLEFETELMPYKQLSQSVGRCLFADAAVAGYEIHIGRSSGKALLQPAFQVGEKSEGALSADGQILGTYLHGVFDLAEACDALLTWAGLSGTSSVDLARLRGESLDRIASACTGLLNVLETFTFESEA